MSAMTTTDFGLAHFELDAACLAEMEQMLQSYAAATAGLELKGMDPVNEFFDFGAACTDTVEDKLAVDLADADVSSPISSASESSFAVASPAVQQQQQPQQQLIDDLSGLAAMVNFPTGQMTLDAVSQWAAAAAGPAPFVLPTATPSISPALLQLSPFVAGQVPVPVTAHTIKRRFSETEESESSASSSGASVDVQLASAPAPPAKRPRGRPPKRQTSSSSPSAVSSDLARSDSRDMTRGSSPVKSASSKARPSAAVPQKFMADAVEILGMDAEHIRSHVDFESILSEVPPERYAAAYAFGQKIADNRQRQAEAAAKARADKLNTKASLEHERDAAIAERDEALERENILAATLVAAQAEIIALKQQLGLL